MTPTCARKARKVTDLLLSDHFYRVTSTRCRAHYGRQREVAEPVVRTAVSLVRCPYAHHAMGSEEVRLDPLTGNFSRISVLDGNFVEVSKGDPNFPTYSDTRWEPFQEWMMANYPDDWQFLRADSSWHTEESFRLWDQRITEYVEAKTSS